MDTLRSGLPFERALLLEAYGRVDANWAKPEKASERLAEALMLLRELGASPDERVHRTIGALPPRDSATCG